MLTGLRPPVVPRLESRFQYSLESPARSFGVENGQLLTQSEIFEDKVFAGPECTKKPTKEVPKSNDHGKNLTETPSHPLAVKPLILSVYDVLMAHNISG